MTQTKTNTVTFIDPKDMRWALFGRHIYHDHLIKNLANEGFPPPIVIVDPDEQYERDKRLLSKHGLFSDLEAFERDSLIEKHTFSTVNDEACLKLLKDRGCNMGFSIACRSIFKTPIIDFFNSALFNLHDSFLPEERGGALNSWRILNDVNTVGATIHLLEEGIDTGAIMFRSKREVMKTLPKPIDYDIAQLECAHVILDQFIDAVISGDTVESIPQDNDTSLYFPRLYTELNGAINFNWSAVDIEKFVRAFSDPYPGAFTLKNDLKIFIDEVELVSEGTFHPFCNGRVVTVLEDGAVNVIAGNGMLRIRTVIVDGCKYKASAYLDIRDVLHTPASILEEALLSVPNVRTMQ